MDKVISHSMTSVQGSVAQSNRNARRYPAHVAPFAASIDFTARSFQSLLGLRERGDDRIALFTLGNSSVRNAQAFANQTNRLPLAEANLSLAQHPDNLLRRKPLPCHSSVPHHRVGNSRFLLIKLVSVQGSRPPICMEISEPHFALMGARTGNCLRVSVALEVLGIPYEQVRIDLRSGEQRQAEFLAINPFGHVPVLVDRAAGQEGFVLTQSNAILLHLTACS